ncbi:tetrapyrrole biosynthesis, uroporphyrinogen III synthase [Abortiporus biennis]|nr:tetrapyrrole biosynthesis, uroporphyrinogen III synthase [Abortiporus biennis]
MAHVLLLRSSQDVPDRYEVAFKTRGFHPTSIPVLETVHVNLDELRNIVRAGGRESGFDGVIITSARACEAWREVVKDTSSEGEGWQRIPFYVVGEATSNALSDISQIAADQKLIPKDIRGGSTSGNSEKLAHFILEDQGLSLQHDQGTSEARKLRMLYLTGDKNRDTLPTILGTRGVELLNLQVYETQGSSTFEADLTDHLKGKKPKWIVYFAPSAAAFVTPVLRKYLMLPDSSDNYSSSDLLAHIAAIGPTTSIYLVETLNLRVDVVAPKPTPDALAEAIVSFDTTV